MLGPLDPLVPCIPWVDLEWCVTGTRRLEPWFFHDISACARWEKCKRRIAKRCWWSSWRDRPPRQLTTKRILKFKWWQRLQKVPGQFFKIGNSWYQFSDAQAANIGKKSKRNTTDLVIFVGVCKAQAFETCEHFFMEQPLGGSSQIVSS